jgi:hypothetical protein
MGYDHWMDFMANQRFGRMVVAKNGFGSYVLAAQFVVGLPSTHA